MPNGKATQADQDLIDLLSEASTGNIVTVGFENSVESHYEVKIIEIGANVYYDDGSIETLGPRSVSLDSGGYAVLLSRKTPKCCNRIFGALKVQQRGHNPTVISEFRYPGSGDDCLLVTRFVLEVKKFVKKASLKEEGNFSFDVVVD